MKLISFFGLVVGLAGAAGALAATRLPPEGCSRTYAAIFRQSADTSRLGMVQTVADSWLNPVEREEALKFLEHLPPVHPFRQFLNSVTPGQRDEMSRVLVLAIEEFGPRASLMKRASEDIGQLSMTERRALELYLNERWWYQSTSDALSRTSVLTNRLRVTTYLDSWFSNGRSPHSPGQLERLLEQPQSRVKIPDFVKEIFNRNRTAQELARSINLSRAREELKVYFESEHAALEREIAGAPFGKRQNLEYLKLRLEQLQSYLEIPESEWREVASRNPKYAQLLFELVPQGLRSVETTVGVGMPLYYLHQLIFDYLKEKRDREMPPEQPFEPPVIAADPHKPGGFLSTDPAPSTPEAPENPQLSLIRRYNSGEITREQYQRELRKLESKRKN